MLGRCSRQALTPDPSDDRWPEPLADGLSDPLAASGVPAGPDPLPELSVEELETLWDALDPVLDGFGSGASCLDDACAFLARLGIQTPPQGGGEGPPASPLLQWLERWRAAGGNRDTLRLMVGTLLARR
jgi:hypothetical protein